MEIIYTPWLVTYQRDSKREIKIYGDKITTTDKSIDTLVAMLKMFKASKAGETHFPQITTIVTMDQAKKACIQAGYNAKEAHEIVSSPTNKAI